MPIEPTIKLSGFRDLDRFLARLPNEAAGRLQAVLVKNHLEHRREVLRTSTFSAEGKRRLRFAIRVFPSRRVQPTKIEDVEAGTASWWKGGELEDPSLGAAARLEKRVGSSVLRPVRRRYLLIPFGDFITRTGRPRRERRTVQGRSVMAPVLIRELPGTRVVTDRSGRKKIIQRLPAGRRGRFESGIKGVRGTRLGARERVVGLLVRQARQIQGIDFHGSWDRLEASRDARFARMLDDLVGR